MELLIKKKVSSGRWDEIKPDEKKSVVGGGSLRRSIFVPPPLVFFRPKKIYEIS